LENHDAFSVSEYDARMQETTGRFYLGDDDEDRFQLESSAPNAYLLGMDTEKVCATTEKHAKTVLQGIIHASRRAEAEEQERRKVEGLRYSEPLPGITIPLRTYGAGVLLRVANEYFGVPVDPSSSALAKVRAVSAYIFYPNPEAFVGELARAIGPAIAGEIREAVLAASPDPSGTLVEQLLAARAPSEGLDDDWVVRSVGGVFSGFFVPTIASFVSIMRGWHQRGELGRARLRYQRGNEDKNALQAMFMEELRKMPMPSLLHRKAAADVELASGARIAKGDTVVVGLVNAPAPDTGDPTDDLLFGAGRHWCKGANMALGVLRGLIATVLANDDLRPGTSELDLRYVDLSETSGST
jgi:cytochrome P450